MYLSLHVRAHTGFLSDKPFLLCPTHTSEELFYKNIAVAALLPQDKGELLLQYARSGILQENY